MANEQTFASVDSAVAQIWIAEELEALYEEKQVAKEPIIYTQFKEGLVKGDIVNFSELSTMTVGNVGTDGAVNNQTITHTARTVTIDQHRECTVEVVDRAGAQSVLNYDVIVFRDQAKALGEDMDIGILDDHSSFNGANAIGEPGNPGPMSLDLALEADQVLWDAKVPGTEPRHWLVAPKAYRQFYNNNLLSSAADSGSPKSAAVSGKVPDILGYQVIRTANVRRVGNPAVHKNLLLARRGVGLAMSIDLNPEIFRVRKSKQYSTDVLWGEGVLRSNFAVTINSQA